MIPLSKTLRGTHIPERVLALPRDARGFPIPWFVHRDRNGPDFRIIGRGRLHDAIQQNLCWICGHHLARTKAFVIGPMCTVNRVSAEPPSHRSCAMFAAAGCPFLTRPAMSRNEKGMEETQELGGYMLKHNPGVCAVWLARDFRLYPVENGMLFRIGEPAAVLWFAHGRAAKRDEVLDAVKRGLPYLLDAARDEGQAAVDALLQQIKLAAQYLPPREPDDAQEQEGRRTRSRTHPGDRQRAQAEAPGDVQGGDETRGQEPARDRAADPAA
jgi:hypothetical protein